MSRFRKRGAVALSASVALIAGVLALGPSIGGASSHREAPLIAGDPQVDTTDLFAFVSPDAPNTVSLVSNWYPFEEPGGGPNFYTFDPTARYDFNIDNDGNAVADVIYRFKFHSSYQNPNTFLYNTGPVTSLTDPDLNFRQTYDLTRLNVDTGKSQKVLTGVPVVPSNVGAASMPAYKADLYDAGDQAFAGGTAFAGQSDDPFFLDLRVFDFLYGGNLSEAGDDTLAGFNTNVLALQLPKDKVALDQDSATNPIVGVWATAARRSQTVISANGTKTGSGPWVQISRLGNPLVNEVVIPASKKDLWNGSKPTADGQFAAYVTNPELPVLLNAVYGLPIPATPRNDLVQVFLTGVPGLNQPAGVTPSEEMRLNMSIAPCEMGPCGAHSDLGVIGGDTAGYPNGRRLTDDIIDISLQVVEGELAGNPNALGDGVSVNDSSFEASFPYVAVPHSGSDPMPHP